MSKYNIIDRIRNFNLRDFIIGRLLNMNNKETTATQYDNYDEIELWTSIYEGRAPWIKDTTYNLDGEVLESQVLDSGTGAALAAEMARLTTLKIDTEIYGGDRAKFLNREYQKTLNNMRINIEYALAKGSMIFKPFIHNGRIGVNFRQADTFIPIEFNTLGELIEVEFIDQVKIGKVIYTKIERHKFNEDTGDYLITNKAYASTTSSSISKLGKEVPLDKVKSWSKLLPEDTYEGLPRPLFVYFKPPVANSKDSSSELGTSVFAKVEGLLEEVDKLYSTVLWEYEGTQLAIDVDESVLLNKKAEGRVRSMPSRSKRLFRSVDGNEGMFKVFNPEIREESYFNGWNKLLRRIEFNVGLAYGTISEVSEVEKTAEEIRSSKNRTFNTIADIQKSLESSLRDLIKVMDILADTHGLEGSNDEDYEVTFNWDSSTMIDEKTELAVMLDEVKSGIIKPEYYLMKRYGLSLEDAIDRLPDNARSESVDAPRDKKKRDNYTLANRTKNLDKSRDINLEEHTGKQQITGEHKTIK